MKRLVLFALLLAFAASAAPALAAEPTGMVTLDLKRTFAALRGAFGATDADPTDAVFEEFAKRTGMRPDRDLTRAGILVDELMKEQIAVFVEGTFDDAKLAAELLKAKEFTLKEEPLGTLRAFKDARTRFVLTRDRLIAGPAGSPWFADEASVRALIGRLEALPRGAIFALSFRPPAELRPMLAAGLPPDVPPPVAALLKELEALTLVVNDTKLELSLTVADQATLDSLRKIYEGLVEMAKARFEKEEKDGLAAIAETSTLRLFSPEVFGRIQGAATGRKLLELLRLNFDGRTVSLSVDHAAGGSLPMLLPVAGIVAAIAIPNFQKARTQARHKACLANMRVLEGGSELLLMDAAKRPEAITVEDLLTGKYLKAPPSCPDGGDYSIDLTQNSVTVRCSKHGGVE